MNRMLRIVAAGVCLSLACLALSGCDTPTIGESKKDAYSDWARDRAKINLDMAVQSYQIGDLTAARAKAQEAYKLDDQNPDIVMMVVKLDIEQGRYVSAEKELKHLRDLTPRSSDVYYHLGIVKEKRGKFPEALECYKMAYEFNNTHIAPVLAAAEVLVLMDKDEEALAYLEKHMNAADQDPATFEIWGRLALRCKDYLKAVQAFQKACVLDRDSHRYPELLASACYSAGKYRRCNDVLDELCVRKDFTPQPWVEVMRGNSLLAVGDASRALLAFQSAQALDKRRAEPHVGMAKAYLMMNELTKAVRAAEEAQRLDGKNLDSAYLLGYLLLRQKKSGQAIKVLERTCLYHPQESMARSLLGQAYQAAGDSVKARACYERALQLNPNDPVAKHLSGKAEKKSVKTTMPPKS